jgi:hypothetical protein
MARIVITAKVNDAGAWEKSFRTHADVFRTQAVDGAMHYTTTADNDVVVCADTHDLATFMKVLESQVTIDAMAQDGVRSDTVKIYVLDDQLDL